MIRYFFYLLIAFLMLGLNPSFAKSKSSYQSDVYKIDHQYSIILYSKADVPKEKMREYALQKAAETASQNGFRYFTIQSESEVVVVSATPRDKGPPPPINRYYELIMQGNFGQDHIVPSEPSEEGVFPGYQLVISGTNDQSAGALDVCDYIACKK